MFEVKNLLADLENDMKVNRDFYRTKELLIVRELNNEHRRVFFLAIEPKEEKRLLIIPITEQMKHANLKFFPHCKGVQVERVEFAKIGPLENQVCFTIGQTSHDKITFEAFIFNLLEELWPCRAEDVLGTIQKMLQKWHEFFSKAGDEGLTPEERRGLYGELYFLRCLLRGGVNPSVVSFWQGPYRKNIDFILNDTGVEMKTTLSERPLKVTISNEEQLDTDEVRTLILGVLSLKSSKYNGELLLDIINEIRQCIRDWPLSNKMFEEALLKAGYHDMFATNYESERYIVLGRKYYKVDEDFPKLSSSMLPKGVINVKYDVILDGLQEQIVEESNIIQMIKQEL
ncbi:PD-(D/E)XK motif protein [Paenibacillus anseongense]|uniref:PD-(D/E)XK motif protein n=1 Tax=Paenibacillus anseongense TaxID=2682845 RepID=UPI002DBAC440|nr:PD-(D/E)XK motif protein [Paenibacillus anseongense]MEC0269706.1 PD-(D/E)XK motif protein [Paenibacillus anseongense]